MRKSSLEVSSSETPGSLKNDDAIIALDQVWFVVYISSEYDLGLFLLRDLVPIDDS